MLFGVIFKSYRKKKELQIKKYINRNVYVYLRSYVYQRLFFLHVDLSSCSVSFISAWGTFFSVSYRAGLLAANHLHFCLSRNVFMSPSSLKNILPDVGFLVDFFFFSFSTTNRSSHCLLSCMVSDKTLSLRLFSQAFGCCRLSISFQSLDKVDSNSSCHLICCFCVGGTLLEVPTPLFLLTTLKFKKLWSCLFILQRDNKGPKRGLLQGHKANRWLTWDQDRIPDSQIGALSASGQCQLLL